MKKIDVKKLAELDRKWKELKPCCIQMFHRLKCGKFDMVDFASSFFLLQIICEDLELNGKKYILGLENREIEDFFRFENPENISKKAKKEIEYYNIILNEDLTIETRQKNIDYLSCLIWSYLSFGKQNKLNNIIKKFPNLEEEEYKLLFICIHSSIIEYSLREIEIKMLMGENHE